MLGPGLYLFPFVMNGSKCAVFNPTLPRPQQYPPNGLMDPNTEWYNYIREIMVENDLDALIDLHCDTSGIICLQQVDRDVILTNDSKNAINASFTDPNDNLRNDMNSIPREIDVGEEVECAEGAIVTIRNSGGKGM